MFGLALPFSHFLNTTATAIKRLLSHTSAQKDRFTDAVCARNIRFRLYGQPEVWHHCHKCMREYRRADGQGCRKVWLVVIDGVTVGHTCCCLHNCHTPLANNHHYFCPDHAHTHNTICAIVGCDNPIIEGSLTCAIMAHQEVECIHQEWGQAHFQLKEQLQCAQVAHPNDATPDDHPIPDLIDMDDDEEEEFDVDNKEPDADIQQLEAIPKLKKIQAQFGCWWTYNEQIIVAPCGMIIAHETFYGAEGVTSVIVGSLSPAFLWLTFYDRKWSSAPFMGISNRITSSSTTIAPSPKWLRKILTSRTLVSLLTSSTSNASIQRLTPFVKHTAILQPFQSLHWKMVRAGTLIHPLPSKPMWLGGYHSICWEMLIDSMFSS